MLRLTLCVIVAALAAVLILGPAARADDTDLFSTASVLPHVLIILDTSQSMTWYNPSGDTLGDEFAGYQTTPPSRISVAKNVLDQIVTAYADQVKFGLQSYKQGDASTNVTVWGLFPDVGTLWSYYYSEGWAAFPWALAGNNDPALRVIGSRYYLKPTYLNLYGPQAGVGGPASPSDPNGYDPGTFRPNSPSFTVTWRLQPDQNLNPVKEFWPGQAYVPPVTHNEDRCRYGYQRSDDNQATWYQAWGETLGDPAGCPPGPYPTPTGTTVYEIPIAVTNTCNFSYKKLIDDPKPWVYGCTKYNNGAPVQNFTQEWATDQGPSYSWSDATIPGYHWRPVSFGLTTITITDDPGQAYRPDQYRWTYYYDATCPANGNCANTGSFWQWSWSTPWYSDDAPCSASTVNNPWTDPAA